MSAGADNVVRLVTKPEREEMSTAESTIAVLEHLLVLAQAGQLAFVGCVAIERNGDKRFMCSDSDLPEFAIVGAIERIKHEYLTAEAGE